MVQNESFDKLKKELEKAQGIMNKYYNIKQWDVFFKLGEYVNLKFQSCWQKSLKKKFNVKLSQRYYR